MLSTPMVSNIWDKSFSVIPICLAANTSVFMFYPIKCTKLGINSLKIGTFDGLSTKVVNHKLTKNSNVYFCTLRTFKAIFDFYLDASVHVALAVASLLGVTLFLLEIDWNVSLVGFVFFSTIVCYNFVKYGVEAYKYLVVSNLYHQIIQIFSFISFGFALFFLWHLEKEIWMIVALLGLLSTLYAVPLLPHNHNLRSLGGFKIYIVAVVWVGFTVLLPVFEAKIPFGWDIWTLCLQRFILVLVLILPFEIRDLQWDDKSLKTLPQILGIKKTQRLGILLTIVFFLLTFLKDGVDLMEIVMRSLLSIFLVLILLSSKKMQGRYFASFWVEAVPVLWLFLFWLEEVIF